MADARFFRRRGPFSLFDLCTVTGARLSDASRADAMVDDVLPLDRAGEHQVSFLDNPRYIESFRHSRAGACFVRERYAESAPSSMTLLLAEDPYRCYALAAQHFYPLDAAKPGISSAFIDPSARLGKDCAIAPGAFIGPNAEIGDRVVIGPNAVIEEGVVIGADSRIGALSSISHCLIGERVVIHRGVHIGQDGFGFAMHREGHVKVPQLGRVVIDDDVEIGAGTCIDRGTGPDTHVGRGAKIDNLVQIGHNVQIGALAVIVAQTGIAGSTRIGDGAVLAGQVGISGHLKIGPGARLAAKSGVMTDIPAGGNYGGSPAVPIKEWHRQTVVMSRLAKFKRRDDE